MEANESCYSLAEGAYLIHWRNKNSPNHNHDDALAIVQSQRMSGELLQADTITNKSMCSAVVSEARS